MGGIRLMLKINLAQNEKGQVLVFAIVTMTVALALGVGLSLETISSVSNVSDSDSSQKALAAAEGAAERLLAVPATVLDGLVDGGINQTECESSPINGTWENSDCYVEFPQTIEGVTVTPRAKLIVSAMDPTTPGFSIPLDKDEIVQLDLANGADTPQEVEVCWKPTVQNTASLMYLMAMNDAGENEKRLVLCDTGISECSDLGNDWNVGSQGIEVATSGATTDESCYDFNFAALEVGSPGDGNPDIDKLRVQSLGGPSEFTVRPAAGVIPSQGYSILAIGEIAQDPTVQRQVRVSRTYSYVPKIFDFSFYSKNNISTP